MERQPEYGCREQGARLAAERDGGGVITKPGCWKIFCEVGIRTNWEPSQ